MFIDLSFEQQTPWILISEIFWGHERSNSLISDMPTTQATHPTHCLNKMAWRPFFTHFSFTYTPKKLTHPLKIGWLEDEITL